MIKMPKWLAIVNIVILSCFFISSAMVCIVGFYEFIMMTRINNGNIDAFALGSITGPIIVLYFLYRGIKYCYNIIKNNKTINK